MRMYRALIALLILFGGISPSNAAPDKFTFTGGGLGHGVGLSQIGARAMALEGKSAEEILKYYYTGVNVEPLPDWYDLRINIGHQLTTASLQLISGGSLLINDYQLSDAKTIAVFTQTSAGIRTVLKRDKVAVATLPAVNQIEIRWTGTRFLAGETATVAFNSGKSIRYRYGEINLVTVGKKFEATNKVRLKDEYLYGISEVSSAWPAESLKAQVIAARTYAISKAGEYRPSCDCELYGTIKDQLFVGMGKLSEPKYGELWKAAVDATSIDSDLGLAITYDGYPISAYYSSSTNGQTESAFNAFGTAVDYLVPVSDPGSLNPKLNPKYLNWTRDVSASVVAKAFGLEDVTNLTIKGKRIEAISSSGKKVSLRLETFRSRAALPSPFFSLSGG